MDSSSSSSLSSKDSIGDGGFNCGICLELLYKPVVLACGHISCFWCVHKAMHGLRASYCAICRQQYYHFPSICGLLHLLLLKMEPLVYKSREKEVLEDEKVLGCFSPRFVDHLSSEIANAEEIEVTEYKLVDDRDIAKLSENELHGEVCKQVAISDVSCVGCKKLLLRPAVLNCGHVYCISCLSVPKNGLLKCDVCHSIHPGNFPKICLELDHFLEEQFPKEYSARHEIVHKSTSRCQHGGPSINTPHSQEQNTKSFLHGKDENSHFKEDFSNVHIGIGCDLCGANVEYVRCSKSETSCTIEDKIMYPIIGKRYRCKDCKEKIGFDVCVSCYNTNSKIPGRFNQQHTPDHRFELDDSRLLSRILMRKVEYQEEDEEDTENEEVLDPLV